MDEDEGRREEIRCGGTKKKTQVWGPPCEFGRRLHGLLDRQFASVRVTVDSALRNGTYHDQATNVLLIEVEGVKMASGFWAEDAELV